MTTNWLSDVDNFKNWSNRTWVGLNEEQTHSMHNKCLMYPYPGILLHDQGNVYTHEVITIFPRNILSIRQFYNFTSIFATGRHMGPVIHYGICTCICVHCLSANRGVHVVFSHIIFISNRHPTQRASGISTDHQSGKYNSSSSLVGWSVDGMFLSFMYIGLRQENYVSCRQLLSLVARVTFH